MNKLKVTTPRSNTIVFERFFAAPIDRVFHAYTDAESMKQWYGDEDHPVQQVVSDLRAGGELQIHWGGGEGGMVLRGKWLEIKRPSFIKFSENWDEDWTGGEVINEVKFVTQDGGTMTILTSTYSSQEARDGALGGASEGFAACLDQLEELLLTGA